MTEQQIKDLNEKLKVTSFKITHTEVVKNFTKKPKVFTREKLAYAQRRLNEGASISKIGRELGVKRDSVAYHIKRGNLTRPK